MRPVTDSEVAALGGPGYFVRDGFLGPALAQAAYTEASALFAAGRFERAGIRRGTEHRLDDAVRSDSTVWVTQEDGAACRSMWDRFEALRRELNASCWLGLQRFEVQLAHYGGDGAHYARHRDAFPGDDNRRLTAIAYLNPSWEPCHGGQLRLFGEGAQDVAPLLDRLVVLRSEHVEHEVLPSFAGRLAVAAWYSAR